jgi:hypothetical protein
MANINGQLLIAGDRICLGMHKGMRMAGHARAAGARGRSRALEAIERVTRESAGLARR